MPNSRDPQPSAPTQTEATVVLPKKRQKRRPGRNVAAVLLAHAPATVTPPGEDRVPIGSSCVVGRGSEASLRIPDARLSQQHFRISKAAGSHRIEDLGSTNGTLVDGQPLEPDQPKELSGPALLRAGDCVFVFHPNAGAVLDSGGIEANSEHPMAGKFHLPVLLQQLMEAALSHRAPLLAGPSGVGKEHAAELLAALWGLGKPRRYNVASATSPEEMSRALFGVASKAFTGVAEQPGLIVTAAKQSCPLFLDEVHHLSPEAQATLLTVIEDGKFHRKGAESEEVHVDLRFVLASNEPDKLKHDLRARLWRVDIPSLRDRVADVPDVFRRLLERQLAQHGLDAAGFTRVDADTCYDVCLEVLRGKAFEQSNVRGLADLADRIAVRVASGTPLEEATDSVMDERLSLRADTSESDGSHYERYRELISAVYLGCGKNAKKTVDLLRDAGLPWTISRRHLTLNVERWGLK
jgi:hypothetical protein